jgi:hypothetical protein
MQKHTLNMRWPFPWFAVMTVAGLVACGSSPAIHKGPQGSGSAFAQSSAFAASGSSVELEEMLFVQDPHFKSGNAGIQLLWIPEPLQKYCLGKTAQQCSAIDYCIRTTTKNVPICKNLPVDITRIPAFPHDMRPKRVMSIVLLQLTPSKGFGSLQQFYDNASKATLDRLSTSARIKARIRFTRSANDDDFQVLEVLAVPPF